MASERKEYVMFSDRNLKRLYAIFNEHNAVPWGVLKVCVKKQLHSANKLYGQQANEVCAYCSMTYPILTDKGNDTYQLILEKNVS